jgi:hypothetical protein
MNALRLASGKGAFVGRFLGSKYWVGQHLIPEGNRTQRKTGACNTVVVVAILGRPPSLTTPHF